jgi:hypothetical protein
MGVSYITAASAEQIIITEMRLATAATTAEDCPLASAADEFEIGAGRTAKHSLVEKMLAEKKFLLFH